MALIPARPILHIERTQRMNMRNWRFREILSDKTGQPLELEGGGNIELETTGNLETESSDP